MTIYALIIITLLSSGDHQATVSYHENLLKCQVAGMPHIVNPEVKFVGCSETIAT